MTLTPKPTGAPLMNGIDLDMTAGPDPGRGWRDIWTATVAFRPIVFQVFGSAAPELLDGFKPNTVNTHILWPYRGRFRWVPSPGLSEQQLLAFGDGLLKEVRRQVDARGATWQ
jgi:hypothetical protein